MFELQIRFRSSVGQQTSHIFHLFSSLLATAVPEMSWTAVDPMSILASLFVSM
jgi:hypothetical protein